MSEVGSQKLHDSKLVKPSRLTALILESEEILKIVTAIVKRSREKDCDSTGRGVTALDF